MLNGVNNLNNADPWGGGLTTLAGLGRAGARAFTLIELLVVIGIIAVLAGLLLPALNNARAKARQLNCMGNLKSMGVSAVMYVDDNNGYALAAQPAGCGNWLNYMAVDMLRLESGSTSRAHATALACPDIKPANRFNPVEQSATTVLPLYDDAVKAGEGGYIMNVIYPNSVATNKGWNYLGGGAAVSNHTVSYGWTDGQNMITPIKFSQAVEPSAKIHVVDSPDAPWSSSTTSNGINRFTSTDWGQRADHPANDGTIHADDRKVAWQHLGGFNAMFGDGHVESRRSSKETEWKVYEK